MDPQAHKVLKALLVIQAPLVLLAQLRQLLVQQALPVLVHKAQLVLQVRLDKMATVIRLQAQQAIQLAMVKNHSLLVQVCLIAKRKISSLVITAIQQRT